MESVRAAVEWLGFVPARRHAPLPVVDVSGIDTIERRIAFRPAQATPYDARHLFTGALDEHGVRQLGFCDRDSFVECLAGWAKTVVVGRGRLGGIPVGLIATENRTVEATTPADPADASSQERTVTQAGRVWFPDSAYKTAQAIRDFQAEDLPLFIFANWRGFSGGLRDMFDEVLKYGAMIVDALVHFTQPVFVYIPPAAELRGGAWVVIDSTINSDVMEMYAAEGARGGVLEAAGIVEIKYRTKDLLATMHRIDPQLVRLDAVRRADATAEPGDRLAQSALDQVAFDVQQREKLLLPIYTQIAAQFADLHDTPGRMAATGVIVREVEWESARSVFYWRLRRRLAEFSTRKRVKAIFETSMSGQQASAVLKDWFADAGRDDWSDDREVETWLQQPGEIEPRLKQLRARVIEDKVKAMVRESPSEMCQAMMASFALLGPTQRAALKNALSAAGE